MLFDVIQYFYVSTSSLAKMLAELLLTALKVNSLREIVQASFSINSSSPDGGLSFFDGSEMV